MLRPALLITLLLGATTASAQTMFSLGVRGGANRATTTVDPAANQSGSYPYSYATDKGALTAWQVGVVLEARRGNFAVQPALLFSQKGEQLDFTLGASGVAGTDQYNINTTNRYNWLELPLNFVYTLHGDHGLQLLAGPYLALAVGGQRRGTSTYSSPYVRTQPVAIDEPITYGPGTYNRRLDAGLNFGLGYRQGPVQVQFSYGLGLRNRNLYADDVIRTLPYDPTYFIDRNNAAYNRVAQLTASYFFKL